MQIVEAGIMGVRSAVITMRRPDTAMRIVIFPMIHVAAPAFYENVMRKLRQCQIVVAEGITGKSEVGDNLTLSYRLLARNRKLGLVVQRLDLRSLGVPVINPDMTGEQFDSRWRAQVPRGERALLALLAPIYGAGMRAFGTRWIISQFSAVDDLPTIEEELRREAGENVDKVMIDERDALVVDALLGLHDEHGAEPITVGVVYGAGHVPGIATGLLARAGYRARSAEWLTVFDL